jgi:hypothetical protein
MPSRKYSLPDFLIGRCTPEVYYDWLEGRALAHVRRDRQRGHLAATREAYMVAIHAAALKSGGLDDYTGKPMDWEAIGTWNNADSQTIPNYKKQFWNLPTVDHFGKDIAANAFRICSWQTNDCKNDLSHDQFVEFCRSVVGYHESTAIKSKKKIQVERR